MADTKYIEIDSSFRNRTRFPQPSSFILPVSNSGRKSKSDALDPVSDMAPIVTWIPNNITGAGAAQLGGTNLVVGSSSTSNVFTISVPVANAANQTLNYYKGHPVTVAALGTSAIDDWRYVGRTATLDYFKVTVTPYLLAAPANGDAVSFPQTTFVANNRYYIPGNQTGLDSYYVGYILWNDTKRQSATITGHIGSSRIVILDSVTDTVLATWALTDTIVLRKRAPTLFGVLAAGTNTTTQVTLSTGALSTDSEYLNDYIRFSSDSANNALETRRIVAYDGTTRVATLFPALSVTSAAADEFEILQFTYDNVYPISYNGPLVNERKMNIRLVNIILPNNQLISGANVTSYPKIYIRLRNLNTQTSTSIYSNNPNANTMLFQTTVSSDIVDPNTSIYIKLFGDGMSQTIGFALKSNIEFGVYLQDGTLYTAIESDTVSPLAPNRELQISALFEITPLH